MDSCYIYNKKGSGRRGGGIVASGHKISKKKKMLIIVGCIVTGAIVLFSLHYFLFAVPTVRRVSEEKVRAASVVAVENAARNTFTSNFSHADFVTITHDNDGNILLLQANTMFINALVRNSIYMAHQNLSQVEDSGVAIPLGAFFGTTLLAAYGPPITLRVLSVGIAQSFLHSDFISAGINQTLHRITLTLSAEVTLIMPGLQSTVRADIPVPIIESTIIGTVPDVFLGTDIFNRSLNLAP